MVRMFLRFFGFGILAFEVGERHIQRLVFELDWMFIDATSANFRLADNTLRMDQPDRRISKDLPGL